MNPRETKSQVERSRRLAALCTVDQHAEVVALRKALARCRHALSEANSRLKRERATSRTNAEMAGKASKTAEIGCARLCPFRRHI
jgi:prephenate dehydratase